MTTDSIPELFSQLRDVFPQLDAHSYFELGQDVKDLISKFQASDPHLHKVEAWSFVRHLRLIWTLVGAGVNLRRCVVTIDATTSKFYILIRDSAISEDSSA